MFIFCGVRGLLQKTICAQRMVKQQCKIQISSPKLKGAPTRTRTHSVCGYSYLFSSFMPFCFRSTLMGLKALFYSVPKRVVGVLNTLNQVRPAKHLLAYIIITYKITLHLYTRRLLLPKVTVKCNSTLMLLTQQSLQNISAGGYVLLGKMITSNEMLVFHQQRKENPV